METIDKEILGNMDFATNWYNYVTGEYSSVQPTTDEIGSRYIPQSVAAQGLFKSYRLQGLSVLQSIANVLSLIVTQPPGEQSPTSKEQ